MIQRDSWATDTEDLIQRIREHLQNNFPNAHIDVLGETDLLAFNKEDGMMPEYGLIYVRVYVSGLYVMRVVSVRMFRDGVDSEHYLDLLTQDIFNLVAHGLARRALGMPQKLDNKTIV